MRGNQATAQAPPPRAVTVTPFQQAAASWGLRVLASDHSHQAIFVPTDADELPAFDTPAPYRVTAFVRNREDGSLVPHLTAVYGGKPRPADAGALADFSGGLHFARAASMRPNRPILREVPCRADYGTVIEWTDAWKERLCLGEEALSEMAHSAYLPSVRWIAAYAVEGNGDEGVIFVLESTLDEGFADARVSPRVVAGRAPHVGGGIETRQARFAMVLTRLRYLLEKLEHSLPGPAPASGERPTFTKAGASEVVEAAASAQLFLSHSSSDRDLADAMVDCLERCIPALEGAIVYTSSAGGDYPVGEDLPEALMRDIAAARMVLGLVTENSLNSEWPLFEMYNAIGQRKACFVLGRGMTLDRVPAPLKSKLTKTIDDRSCMPNLVSTVARIMGLEVADKKQVNAMNRFYRFFEASPPPR